MSENDWSRMLKLQDEYVHEEDKREQERKWRIKEIYKNQLEKIIQNQRSHAKDQKLFDKKLVDELYQRDKRRILQEEQIRLDKMRMKQKMAKDNLKQLKFKKEKTSESLEKQKMFYHDKYRRSETEIAQQIQMEMQIRENEKKLLARAYDSQMQLQRSNKLAEKLQDQKFLQLRAEIESKKQASRKDFFQKIRNQYRQNPEVYDTSAAIIFQNEKERGSFVEKLSNEDKNQAVERMKQQIRREKQKETKEASIFNKRYYQHKLHKDRYQSLQQIKDYSAKYRTLQQQIQHQKQEQMRQIDNRRKQLKRQLERQIKQYHYKRKMDKNMNEKEYLFNRSKNIPVLPGISRDYSSGKQHQILENFLLGGSEKKIEYLS